MVSSLCERKRMDTCTYYDCGEEVGDDSNFQYIWIWIWTITADYIICCNRLAYTFFGKANQSASTSTQSNIFHALDNSHVHVYTTNSSISTPDEDEYKTTPSPAATPMINDDGRPPTPWGWSRAKKRVFEELKSDTQDIHLLFGS